MAEKRNAVYKICPGCGAALDPGEHCDCSTSEPYHLPRDGLRATCPYFQQRIDYQGDYRIKCVTRQQNSLLLKQDGLFYPTRKERDREYEQRCCHNGYCYIREIWMKEEANHT